MPKMEWDLFASRADGLNAITVSASLVPYAPLSLWPLPFSPTNLYLGTLLPPVLKFPRSINAWHARSLAIPRIQSNQLFYSRNSIKWRQTNSSECPFKCPFLSDRNHFDVRKELPPYTAEKLGVKPPDRHEISGPILMRCYEKTRGAAR